MRNHLFVKTFNAEEAIAANLIVKQGAAYEGVGVADAGTDAVLGVAQGLIAADSGERLDVILLGIAEVKAGGNISLGARVTASTNGVAVAVSAEGQNILGIAMGAAVSGDLFPVLLTPGAVHAISGAA